MAEYIDKFRVSGENYEIYAKSGTDHAYYVDKTPTAVSADGAKTATKVASTKNLNSTNTLKLSGHLSAEVLTGTQLSAASTTINTIITTTPWSAINKGNASGAASNLTSASEPANWNSSTTRFLTPDKVYGYVSAQTSGIAEANGIYQVKGNSTFANLSNATAHKNGYVFNLTDSGNMPATSAYNGQTFELLPGDNVVWIQDATSPGWDKLANPAQAAMSTLQAWSAASAAWNKFDGMTATVSTGSGSWNNTAHNLFSQVNTNNNGNVKASAYNTTLTLSGTKGVSAGGTSPTALFRLSGVSGFKTIKVTKADGTTANVDANAWASQLTLSASAAITLTPTVDANGNPTITISKTDTSAVKAETGTLGMVQQSYYKDVDTTNHIGTLVIQGNMSSNNFHTL